MTKLLNKLPSFFVGVAFASLILLFLSELKKYGLIIDFNSWYGVIITFFFFASIEEIIKLICYKYTLDYASILGFALTELYIYLPNMLSYSGWFLVLVIFSRLLVVFYHIQFTKICVQYNILYAILLHVLYNYAVSTEQPFIRFILHIIFIIIMITFIMALDNTKTNSLISSKNNA